MTKTLAVKIETLQIENERLKKYRKVIEKAVKTEFDMDLKTLHKIVDLSEINNNFIQRISDYFQLKTTDDYSDFLAIFCTEKVKNFFEGNRTE